MSLPEAATLFTSTSRAEKLFELCNFSVPTGAAALAISREVDLPLLSRAYGHTLGQNVVESLPLQLDTESLKTGLFEAAAGNVSLPLPMPAFQEWLTRVTSASESGANPPELDEAELRVASRMYGAVLGRTVRLSACEFDYSELAAGLESFLADPSSAKPPMDTEMFDSQYDKLQECAASVLGTSNLNNAERFFEVLRKEEGVVDVQGDGYILSVPGGMEKGAEGSVGIAADFANTVRAVLRVRLLDGRVLYMPTFSDGEEAGPDVVEAPLDLVPPAFACVMIGMRVGETKTAFYHPYAACEIMGMFISSDQFPPQGGLVVDITVTEIVKTKISI